MREVSTQSEVLQSRVRRNWKNDWQAIISIFSWASKGAKLCNDESGGASKWQL